MWALEAVVPSAAAPAHVPLPAGDTSFAREPTSPPTPGLVLLPSPHISRKHADITVNEDGEVVLRDVSTNGCRVVGNDGQARKIKKGSSTLTEGDEIMFGLSSNEAADGTEYRYVLRRTGAATPATVGPSAPAAMPPHSPAMPMDIPHCSLSTQSCSSQPDLSQASSSSQPVAPGADVQPEPMEVEPREEAASSSSTPGAASLDLDEIARRLEEEETAAASARRTAAEVHAMPPSQEPAVSDGDNFAIIDFSLPAASAAPPVAPPNKKLNLSLVAEHLEASLPAIQSVAGRKVALLLGNTGVGKSTLLQALAGRSVERRSYVPGSGLDSADAMDCSTAEQGARWVWDAVEPLQGFEIGHEQASETKHIRHYAVSDDSVMYLDAPGYEDTAGVEVDIATSVAFKRVADRCAAMRFVVLIDCHTFLVDRGGAMRRVAALVGAFVRKFKQSRLAFLFLFTKSDALGAVESRATALAQLKQMLLETLRGTADGDVKEMLNSMMSSIHFDSSLVDVYHPGFSDVEKLREAIETFERPPEEGSSKPPTSMALTSPRTDVRCGLTPKAESRIKLDLDAQLEELNMALADGRAASAGGIMRTLAYLDAHVDKPYVHAAHEKALAAWREQGASASLGHAYELIDRGLGRGDQQASFNEEQGREAVRQLGTLRLFERQPAPGMHADAAQTALAHLRRGLGDLRARVEAGVASGHGLSASLAEGAEPSSAVADARAAFACALRCYARLAIWGRVHAEFAAVAEAALTTLSAHEQRLVEYAQPCEAACEAACEAEGAPSLVLALVQLHELCHGADSPRAVDDARRSQLEAALEACCAKVQRLISHSVDVAACSAVPHVDDGGDGIAVDGEEAQPTPQSGLRLDAYLASLACVEALTALLASEASSGAPHALHAAASAGRLTILRHAKTYLLALRDEVERATDACDEAGLLTDPDERVSSMRHVESLLRAMRPLSHALSAAQHAVCDSARLYQHAVSSGSAPACRLLARAKERCERDLREIEPLQSAAAHRLGLAQLSACAPLDGHLAECGLEAFVAAGLEQLHTQYEQFGDRASRAALKALERYLSGWGMSGADEAACVEAAGVLSGLCKGLGDTSPRLGQVLENFSTRVHAAVDEWSRNAQRGAALAPPGADALAVLAEPSAAAMEDALGVCQIIRGCGFDIATLSTLDQQIQERLIAASSALVDLFSAAPEVGGARTDARSATLQALYVLRAKGLSRVIGRLPDIDELRAGVVAEVEGVKAAARDAVGASTGDAAASVAALEQLTQLADAFRDFDFGQIAATTASDLRQMLELRCAKLDEALQESLSSGRFEYVRKYVEPLLLGAPRDPLKREKLNRTLAAARDVLQQKFDGAAAHAADAPRVAEAIGALDDAAAHLGESLRNELGFDVPALAATLRERAAACLARQVTRLEDAISQLDYAQVFEGAAETKDYLSAVSQVLVPAAAAAAAAPASAARPSTRGSGRRGAFASLAATAARLAPASAPAPSHDPTIKARDAMRRAEACLTGVDKAASELIKHVRSQDLGRVGFVTAPLCDRLSKLKLACAAGRSHADTAAQLTERYERATYELSQAFDAKLVEVQSQVKSDQLLSYGLAAFGYVHGELRRGLAEHVTLRVDVEAVLTQLRAQADEVAQRMQLHRLSIEHIDNTVKPTLDRLKQRKGSWFAFWAARQYDEEKASFNAELLKLLEATHTAAAEARQYEQAEQRVLLVQHALRVLDEHVAPEPRRRWGEITRAVVREFSHLCEGVKGALAQADAQSFEVQLRRMHLYEASLGHVCPPELKRAAVSVHAAVCAWTKDQSTRLQQMLADAVELGAAAETVQRLRRVGRVLVSTWALYTEVADAAGRHAKTDAALRGITELVGCFFGGEARTEVGTCYAVLELDEGASKRDVLKAYKEMSKRYHPDKRPASASVAGGGSGGEPSHAMQQRVGRAKEMLEDDSTRERFQREACAPFAAEIRGVPRTVLTRVGELLVEGEYAKVRLELAALGELPKLLALVDGYGSKEQQKPGKEAHKAVKQHMMQIRTDVSLLWERRDFKELNSRLRAADAADQALGGLDGIYDPSWYRSVRATVETEIESIVAGARIYLQGKSEAEAEGHMKDVGHKLVQLGRILDELPRYKDFCRAKMAGLLDTVHEQGSWSYCYLFKLGMLLSQGKLGERDSKGNVLPEDDRIGKTIVAEFQHFKDVTTMVWNEEVTQKDVGAVVSEAEAWRVDGGRRRRTRLDAGALTRGFEQYEKEYQTKFKEWTAGRLTQQELARQAVLQAAAIQPGSSTRWSDAVVAALPTLLARVFCFFTVSKSGESYTRLLEKFRGEEADEADGGGFQMDNVLLKPHCTQVLTVLQMLGYGASDAGGALQRQLMQIRTGEGKSIILGACSAVLALLGFRVRCVCYSDYLSGRDYELFRELFEAFGIERLVTYSTIGEYSEDVTKRKGDIRVLTKALLLGQAAAGPTSAAGAAATSAARAPASAAVAAAGGAQAAPRRRGKKRRAEEAAEPSGAVATARCQAACEAAPEILLVDEVDIFFGEDFYGQTHNQVVQLDVPEAAGVLRAAWRLRHNASGQPLSYGALLRTTKASPEYHALCRRFGEWCDVIEREVEAMCADALVFNEPKPHYDAQLDRLGYKVMDTIDYESAVYGYRTAFAHLHHAESGTFRDPAAALERALQLQVPCGKFSYANIHPECILGVSGTLAALGAYETTVMERYGIQLYASMPSVYGETQLRFDHAGGAITIEASVDSFHRAITDEAIRKTREGRAVIVFFEAGRLEAYTSSPYFKKVLHANVLHERLDPKSRDFVIRKAATSGQATFASEAFGRGTDFFCKDSKLDTAGGVHVLQTFLSPKKADEVQIQGRTARQGKQGTYALVLLQQDLSDRFKLGSLGGVAHREVYAVLERSREAVHATACQATETALQEASRVDAMTHEYFNVVLTSGAAHAARLLHALYKELRGKLQVGSPESYHVIFLMDKSGSMTCSDASAVPGQAWCALGYPNRLGCAMEACDRFVRMRDAAGAADLISVVMFDNGVTPALRAADLHADLITNLVRNSRWSYGGTAFSGAFEAAVALTHRDSNRLPFLIMFLTDGNDQHGDAARLEHAIEQLRQTGTVSMKAVGFGADCNAAHLQYLASRFGANGEYLAAIDGVQLVENFEAAAAELSHTGGRRRT